MYYRGADVVYTRDAYRDTHHDLTCYAESRDGIHWTRPELGLFAFKGSKANNIVWDGLGTHNFTPFKDTNPAASTASQYKALGVGRRRSGAGCLRFNRPGNEREGLTHPERVKLTHLGLQNGRSGQER